KPRRPPGRPVAPEAPAGPSASAARPPSVSEVLRERLGEIAAAAVVPEDALEPALRAILEASRAQAGALCLFDQRHGILRLVAERDVRMLERPLAELAVMIEAVRRRGARVEPVEAPKTPVAAPPPLPQPAAHVTELQAEREQLRGEVAARSAERAVLAAELAA